ncbi:MAG: hypothetical protein M1817_005942 [Caeruleum heppii]|nr:MAG: hypothetical protein M1817_005942 [Caeruleum heppii]
MADSTPKSYSTDPNLYLYTSLTAGSSHIITATSRLETILKANKIPFQALDVATDEKARMLWGRRAGKRKLPGLVRMGMDLEEIEDWNEYGELHDHITDAPPKTGTPSASATATPQETSTKPESTTTSTDDSAKLQDQPKENLTGAPSSLTMAMRQAGAEAARKAADSKKANTSVKSEKPSTASEEVTDSLAHSAGIAPPIGSEDAVQAKATGPDITETTADDAKEDPVGAALKESGITGTSTPNKSSLHTEPSPGAVNHHRGSNVSTASADEISDVEKSNAIAEDPEAEEAANSEDTRVVTSKDDKLLGENAVSQNSQTQDQPAAHGELAGASVDGGPLQTDTNDTAADDTKAPSQPNTDGGLVGGSVDAKLVATRDVSKPSENTKTQDQPAATGALAGASIDD